MSQVEMGGTLLSGGHQSSSPFIVGFAGFILAQEALRRAHVSPRIKGSSRLQTLALLYIGRVNSFFFSRLLRSPPESRKAQCFFLDPETIENQIIYFDQKITSRIVIKRILNYYHHGEKCGKLLMGMSENPKRVSENPRRHTTCLLYTSPSPRDGTKSRMPSSA